REGGRAGGDALQAGTETQIARQRRADAGEIAAVRERRIRHPGGRGGEEQAVEGMRVRRIDRRRDEIDLAADTEIDIAEERDAGGFLRDTRIGDRAERGALERLKR